MAQLLVEVAMDSDVTSRKRTFEAYYTDTAQPKDMRRSLEVCEEQGISMKEVRHVCEHCVLSSQGNSLIEHPQPMAQLLSDLTGGVLITLILGLINLLTCSASSEKE